jgi:uncharacterized membrane protein YagU involved in acid resistance
MTKSLLRRLEHGGLAGLVATIPMTIVMLVAHRRLPRHERYALPPEKITSEFAELVGAESLRHDPALTVATSVAHLAYGAAAGSIYQVGLQKAGQNPLVGITYGLGVWAASYLGLMPALGLHEPATNHPWRRNLLMIGAHVVWGTSLAEVSRALDAD